MAIKLENMEFEVASQSTITSNKNVDFSGSSSVLLPSSSIKGSYSTLTVNYACIAVASNGSNVAVNVFNAATAPVAGTVTGFFTIGGGAAGSAVLWATTAGTIATVSSSATTGTAVGTTPVVASIVAGDTVTVTCKGAGTYTAYVNFQTIG